MFIEMFRQRCVGVFTQKMPTFFTPRLNGTIRQLAKVEMLEDLRVSFCFYYFNNGRCIRGTNTGTLCSGISSHFVSKIDMFSNFGVIFE